MSLISQHIRRNDMSTVISENVFFAARPNAEEKSTDEQASAREAVVKPGEAKEESVMGQVGDNVGLL
jgi:hypothetical protein